MDIELIQDWEDPIQTDRFRVSVSTLDNDDNDNQFNLYFDAAIPPTSSNPELRQCIIDMEILKKQYHNSGMGGGDNYEHLDVWKKYEDKWHKESMGYPDMFQTYDVLYYNAKGKHCPVKLTFDKEMIEEIAKVESKGDGG
jgi:hypothetical protein